MFSRKFLLILLAISTLLLLFTGCETRRVEKFPSHSEFQNSLGVLVAVHPMVELPSSSNELNNYLVRLELEQASISPIRVSRQSEDKLDSLGTLKNRSSSIEDKRVQPGKQYSYLLEELDPSGIPIRKESVSVAVPEDLKVDGELHRAGEIKCGRLFMQDGLLITDGKATHIECDSLISRGRRSIITGGEHTRGANVLDPPYFFGGRKRHPQNPSEFGPLVIHVKHALGHLEFWPGYASGSTKTGTQAITLIVDEESDFVPKLSLFNTVYPGISPDHGGISYPKETNGPIRYQIGKKQFVSCGEKWIPNDKDLFFNKAENPPSEFVYLAPWEGTLRYLSLDRSGYLSVRDLHESLSAANCNYRGQHGQADAIHTLELQFSDSKKYELHVTAAHKNDRISEFSMADFYLSILLPMFVRHEITADFWFGGEHCEISEKQTHLIFEMARNFNFEATVAFMKAHQLKQIIFSCQPSSRVSRSGDKFIIPSAMELSSEEFYENIKNNSLELKSDNAGN